MAGTFRPIIQRRHPVVRVALLTLAIPVGVVTAVVAASADVLIEFWKDRAGLKRYYREAWTEPRE